MARLHGMFTALTTPFKGDSIDHAGFVSSIEDQLNAGVDGLVVAGSTGEDPTLSDEEFEVLVSLAVRTTKGRKPVIAGTGRNSTQATLNKTRKAKALGADLALLILPYYNRPTQEGLIRHIETIATQVDLPLILYNHPGRTGVNMLPETTVQLSKIPNVVGYKECCSSTLQVGQLLQGIDRDDFSVFSGDDVMTLPYMALGGHGVISVASNLVPEHMLSLVRAAEAGDFKTARRLHYELLPLFDATNLETNPMPIKALLSLAGKPAGSCRLPLCDVKRETHAKLKEVLQDLRIETIRCC